MIDGGVRFRHAALAEVAASDRDAEAVDALAELGQSRERRLAGLRRIARVGTRERVEDERQVAGRAGEGADMVEAGAERVGTGARQPAIGRLEAEQAAERRGNPHRAVGVGTERDRHHAGGDRGSRAAGRAARHVARIVRVERGAVMDVLAGEVIGVLAHVEAAEEEAAGR